MRDLARQQRDAAEAETVETYLALTDERERLMETLAVPGDEAGRATARALLLEARELDAETKRRLRTASDSVRSDLARLHRGRAAVIGYRDRQYPKGLGTLA